MSAAAQQSSMQNWEEYYANLKASYLFPNEFVVRTFLAHYPKLDMPHDYEGAKVCDVSCGDGRNLVADPVSVHVGGNLRAAWPRQGGAGCRR